MVAWSGLNLALVLMGLSMVDPNFAAIVTKPDNVPIVGLVFLLGFFTWLATSKAVENDERLKQGLPPLEKLDNEKVLVWPDLVYTELICMIALTAFLLVWGIALQAPLEEPASRVKTPNPSKAPWYFLGLQEMLVYYDPWMAGVLLPSLIVAGSGGHPVSGLQPARQRLLHDRRTQVQLPAVSIRLFRNVGHAHHPGHVFRGPNWNIFGPFEYWDAHKVCALNNVDLSQYFWIVGMGQALPKAAAGSSLSTRFVDPRARRSGHYPAAGLFFVVAAAAGHDHLPALFRQDGIRALHADVQFVAVHGRAAIEDGAALDIEPEVHRQHP